MRGGYIVREDVEDLRQEIQNLSTCLKEMHDFLKSNLDRLEDSWYDEKFFEFRDYFEEEEKKILDLSDSYSLWAKKLNVLIDSLDNNDIGMGIG